MPIEITMPKLTDTMTEATLAKWLKKEGDRVKPGDMIAEVETDKATQELEAFEEGTVAKIMIPEGGKTAVGALIVVLAKPGEDVKQVAAGVKAPAAASPSAGAKTEAKPGQPEAKSGQPEAKAAPAPAAQTVTAPAPAPRAPVAEPATAGVAGGGGAAVAVEDHEEGSEPEVLHTGRIRVSPLARKIAEDRGVDLSVIRGSGPDGRIIKRDVETARAAIARAAGPIAPAASKPAAAPAPAAAPHAALAARLEQKTIALTNMRQTIARRLVQSKQTIPHFYVSIDVVMDKLLTFRADLNEQIAPEKLSVTDLIARASAMALSRNPSVNASFTESAIIQHGTVDLGIAVALEEGLVVPVIRQAHTKSVRQLSQEIKQLAELGRTRKLKAEQMTGSTFTISNLGMYGIKDFSAIINPPESAILAVGGTTWQPVVREVGGKREVVPAQVMNLTLSADHRVVDGATGAKFLQDLKTILEAPVSLLL